MAVAKACGISVSSVTNIKRELNMTKPPSNGPYSARWKVQPHQIVTECEKQKIRRLLRSGMTTLKVAAACGRCEKTVARIRRKMNLPRQPTPSGAKLDEVNHLLAKGEDPSRVAEQCGVNVITVRRLKRELNTKGWPLIKKEHDDSLPLCVESAPDNNSASTEMTHIEFLDEIPFCILI
ncbi:hypothetical protein BC940DRAFT_323873 [Gongronella butleri]|nr:hypothetical protein BC940DRAFT_323873 [Gongronella butleri]